MATNLSIDPDLIEQVLKISGEKTKADAVTKALQEFIARRRQRSMLDLAGKLEWDNDTTIRKRGRGVESFRRHQRLVAALGANVFDNRNATSRKKRVRALAVSPTETFTRFNAYLRIPVARMRP